jgi:hypothetical protein
MQAPSRRKNIAVGAESSQRHRLALVKTLRRNGLDIVRVFLARPMIIAIAKLQTACLRQSKTVRKAKGKDDYYTRSLKGTAGELAFHMLCRVMDLKPRLLLPSLTAEGVDHLINLGSRELRVQSKTICPRDGTTVKTIAGHYLLPIGQQEHVDWYSWAILSAEELVDTSADVTVDLFAFAPMSFVREYAERDRRFGLSVSFEHLRSEQGRRLSHQMLDQDHRLPAELTMTERSYSQLTSASVDDWLLEALDLVGSPSDASRVLDMLTSNPGLLQTLQSIGRLRREQVLNTKDVVKNNPRGCVRLYNAI